MHDDGGAHTFVIDAAKIVAVKFKRTDFFRNQAHARGFAGLEIRTQSQVRNLEAVRDVFGSQFQDDGFTDLEIETIGLVGKLMRSSFITRSGEAHDFRAVAG
jgi:hypothetical protein